MTFLNDLWKKFNAPVTNKKWDDTYSDSEHSNSEQSGPEQTLKVPTHPQATLKQTESDFQKNEEEYQQKDHVLENLKALKEILDKPKEEALELRFSNINQHLGEPECHETVRQDRFANKIQCPSCQSSHLKRIAQLPSKSPYNHRYECLNCGAVFNDDSGTPLETGVPPLNIWMQCWYLMGCTDSLTYIAAKLNLEVHVIEKMANQLRKIFNAQKPLTQFLGYEEWRKQSEQMHKQLKEDLLKQYEFLDANIATAPKDTAEFRRQQNLRRGQLLPPSSGTGAPGTGKKRF